MSKPALIRQIRSSLEKQLTITLAAAEDARMRPFLEPVEHPVTGTVTSVRVPLRANGALPDTLRPAPTFDQHSDEVLRDWIACREERVAALRASGVVGGQPGRT